MKISDIIAQAFLDANVQVVTYVPGYGGAAIFDALGERTGKTGFVSFHEEVAYTVAHSASLMGSRAVLLCKTHGIMKAANSVSDSLLCGTMAGLVAIIPEDKRGRHSDSIIEAKPFLEGIGMPFIMSHPETVYDDVHLAFERSEQSRLPWAIVLDSSDVKQRAEYRTRISGFTGGYVRDVQQHILCPLFNPYQREVYLARMAGRDWRAIPRPPIPTIPDATSAIWRKAIETYEPFFKVYQRFRGELVTGDTGISSQFAVNPYHCMDLVTYMGGSIPLAIGAYLGGKRNVWAISGDFSFLSAGPMALFEATLRNIPLKIILLDNGQALTTGGQPIMPGALDLALAPWKTSVMILEEPDNPKKTETALDQMTRNPDLSILVVKYRDSYGTKVE
jgi:TPP-dependent indolepyruvate ferredoxin oxidoreductase alpha subunit